MIHVEDRVDPVADLEIIHAELRLKVRGAPRSRRRVVVGGPVGGGRAGRGALTLPAPCPRVHAPCWACPPPWLCAQDVERVRSVMESIDKLRSRGLKKDQLEEYALCEKLVKGLEVREGGRRDARMQARARARVGPWLRDWAGCCWRAVQRLLRTLR